MGKPPIVERLLDREAKHRECIANSQIVVDLLRPQMELFDKREGGHNTYAVRMSVDHQSSIRSMTKEADELAEAAEAISELVEALAEARLRLAEIEGAGRSVVDLLDIEAWTGTAKQLDSVLDGCRNTAAEIDPILAKVRP